jgi:hypothetical protein
MQPPPLHTTGGCLLSKTGPCRPTMTYLFEGQTAMGPRPRRNGAARQV